MENKANTLVLKRAGFDTYRENIIFMRSDCHICESEGFTALTRVNVTCRDKSIVATLNVVLSDILGDGEAFLSEIGFERLNAQEGDTISITHLRPILSLSDVRSKMYRQRLSDEAFLNIMRDITDGMYSNIELAAFISACAGHNLDLGEISGLTRAMIATGHRMRWESPVIMDKHCVGGLPGNRTTPIVVAIAAAAGLIIPKTSSRAITSPAGTADVMETITAVDLSMDDIRKVIAQEGGCLAWGGAVQLSPADDILISVERSLDIDSEGQMIASVLSKKCAAGATHVVIDVPVGPTAKVRTIEEANRLQECFTAVGRSIGLAISVLITDGRQPVGRGIGPALEAMDVLSVLRNEQGAPDDLRSRAIHIAGTLLELSGNCRVGEGFIRAEQLLASGTAYKKFEAICRAQGGFAAPKSAPYSMEIRSMVSGTVVEIDNRKLARLAKLAGAPQRTTAGLRFLAPLGTRVEKDQVLFVLYAESPGELEYAMDYYHTSNHMIAIV
jgi:thymidine phosphorylase